MESGSVHWDFILCGSGEAFLYPFPVMLELGTQIRQQRTALWLAGSFLKLPDCSVAGRLISQTSRQMRAGVRAGAGQVPGHRPCSHRPSRGAERDPGTTCTHHRTALTDTAWLAG